MGGGRWGLHTQDNIYIWKPIITKRKAATASESSTLIYVDPSNLNTQTPQLGDNCTKCTMCHVVIVTQIGGKN